jgi:TonB-dependent siderophore receptor
MKLPFVALVAISLLAAAPLHAQDPKPTPDPDKDPPRFADTVDVESELPAVPPSSTTALKFPVPVQELPLSVSVIPRRLLGDQDAYVLSDGLKNASGVNVGTGFGIFDFWVVRGFDSLSSGLVLVDGAREPESTLYPLYNVRQVEVVKGPTFLYGGSSLSGTVNLVRKQPAQKRFADVSLSYGRFGTFEGTVDGNVASGDGTVSFRLNGVYQGTDQYRDLPNGSVGAVNPTLLWRPDGETRMTVGFEYARAHQSPDTGIPFVDTGELASVGRKTSYQSPFDDSLQNVYRVRFDAERKLAERFTLRNKFYYTEMSWESQGTLVSGVVPIPGAEQVARVLTILDDRQKICGDQLEAVATFATGPVRHDFLGGFEFTWLRDPFTQDVAFLPLVSLTNPGDNGGYPVVPIPPLGMAGDSTATVLAPYVVDRMTLSNRWQLTAGARLDSLDYDDPLNATSRNDTKVNPMGGLLYSPKSDLSFYVSAGTAFGPPSTQVIGPRDPEESWQVEAGTKVGFLSGKGFATASVYTLQRDNIAIPDSSGFTTQQGDQRSRGFELEVSAEPRKGWVAYGSYAYSDAKLTSFAEIVRTGQGPADFVVVDRSGNRAPLAPRHIGNLWTSRQFESGLGLAAGLRFVSSQFISEDNRFAIDSYVTVDAIVSYRIGRVRAAVNLKNLTGTEYESRGFGAVSAIPARPFEVLGRIELGFGSR